MNINLAELIPNAVAVLTGAVGWGFRELQSVRKEQAAHRTHVAETYVTKSDSNKSLDRVYDALERIEKKLDERRT
jgi:hypothetical protein